MKNQIIIVLNCILLFGCVQSSERKNNQNSNKNVISNNSVVYKVRDFKDTTKYERISPSIIQLPFGPQSFEKNLNNVEASFYTNLIYKDFGRLINDGGFTAKTLNKIKVYKLPPISKIKYIKISKEDTTMCTNGKPFEYFLKLSKYRYRLPDVAFYQCYYMCDYDPRHKEYSPEVNNICNFFLYDTYGYLILYDPRIKEAKVITIFYNTFRDGLNLGRYFYIDEKYKIHLVNYNQDGDDEPEGKPNIERHTISILNNCVIKVNVTK